MRAVIPRRPLARLLAIGTVTIVSAALAVGCSSQSVGSPAVPAASRQQKAATRAYLRGSGHGLISLDDLAAALVGNHARQDCRSAGQALALLANRQGGTRMVADPQLAELFADELTNMSAVLAGCLSGTAPAHALAVLSRVHQAVNQRLRADGVRR